MNNETKLINFLKEQNIIKNGHFLLTSGLHSDTYIQKDDILIPPFVRNTVIDAIAQECDKYINVNSPYETNFYNNYVIIGPATAGSSFAALVAHQVELPFLYCEKENLHVRVKADPLTEDVTEDWKTTEKSRKMVFRPNFAKYLKDKKVIIIEDIITTGGSVEKTINAVNRCGGEVRKVICIWNRGTYEPYFNRKYEDGNDYGEFGYNIEFSSLISKRVISYTEENCPMCKENIELTTLK